MHFDITHFLSTQILDPKTVDEKRSSLRRRNYVSELCLVVRLYGEGEVMLPFLAFLFCFAQLLPLLRAGDGVEGKHSSYFRAVSLSNLLLGDPVAPEASIDVSKRRI